MEALLSWAVIAIPVLSLFYVFGKEETESLGRGVIVTIISFSFCLLFRYYYIGDEAKHELAETTFKEHETQNFATLFHEEVATISNAVDVIIQHKQKIHTLTQTLTKKAQNVSDAASKKIFENKLKNLTDQESKLNKSLAMLNQCAFEQILVHYAENLSGEHIMTSNFDAQVQNELKIVDQVMKEVNQMP